MPERAAMGVNSDAIDTRRGPAVVTAEAGTAPVPVAPEIAPAAEQEPNPGPEIDPRRLDQALAKNAVLLLYDAHLAKHGRSKRAKDSFISTYNNTKAWESLRDKLGRTSWKTLERWKLIKQRDGVLALADSRGLARRGTCSLNERQQDILLACWLTPNAHNASEAAREALKRYEAEGLPLASERTLCRIISKWASTNLQNWVWVREGKKAWNDKVAFYVERDWTLVEVGDIVVADGHVLNFEILNPATGKGCRMTLVLWLDCRSTYPLGWEITPTESTAAIAAAFRRACLRLGKMPKIAYLDNGKAFNSQYFKKRKVDLRRNMNGLFEELGVSVINAWPYHGQSKTIERFFKTFHELEKWAPSYTGSSIETKPPRMKRGETLHRRAYEQAGGRPLTLLEAHEAVARFFDEYAQRASRAQGLAGQTPLEVFEAGRGPGVDATELRLLMLPKHVGEIGQRGVKLHGQWFWDQRLYGRRHPVVVRHDPQQLSSVLVYDLEGAFICEARPVGRVHPAANLLGTDQDRQLLSESLAMIKGQERLAGTSAKQALDQWVAPEVRQRMEQLEQEGSAEAARQTPRRAETARLDIVPANKVQEPLSSEVVARIEAAKAKEREERRNASYPPLPDRRLVTERDRYEHLFTLRHRDLVVLRPEDAAFMDRYEASREYRVHYRARFEQFLELWERRRTRAVAAG